VTFSWTPFGITGLVAAIVAWSAAVFVFRTIPDKRVRGRLTFLLFAEGLMMITSFASPLLWVSDPTWFRRMLTLHAVADSLIVAAYLPTLAAILGTTPVRWFGTLPGILIPVGIGSVCAIGSVLRPDLAWGAIIRNFDPAYGLFSVERAGPFESLAFALLTVSYLYGLFATLLAWRQSDTALMRRRNGLLSLALGTRDIFWGFVFLIAVVGTVIYGTTGFPPHMIVISIWFLQFAAGALVVYILLLVYGIATKHLFDIDLKVKWTLSRGTVAAAYVAIFFIVSEGAQMFLSDLLGTVLGLVATGLLLFAMTPIQRAAERFSNTAMPDVQDTPEFLRFRKLQIYGQAFTDSRGEGEPNAVQRAALNQLREELDLTVADVGNLEARLSGS